jgi:hypothetical protein
MQKEKLTILIPFRDREENLNIFIPYFTNYMNNYQKHIIYDIVIIEQGNDELFNKGFLFNVGFLLTSGNTDYYALHDVDQLPISVDYSYKKIPYHLSVNIYKQDNSGLLTNEYKNKKFHHRGGVNIIDKYHYLNVNGHSIKYWGWGCEDDDFSIRLIKSGIGYHRIGKNNKYGHYITLKSNNNRQYDNENYINNKKLAEDMLDNKIDYMLDGINTTTYKITNIIKNKEYTKYIADFKK